MSEGLSKAEVINIIRELIDERFNGGSKCQKGKVNEMKAMAIQNELTEEKLNNRAEHKDIYIKFDTVHEKINQTKSSINKTVVVSIGLSTFLLIATVFMKG